jgi:hypothetical protein
MTALAGYLVLEATGRYAESPDAPAREVVVKFGDASLTILTFADIPLAHWPLASLAQVAGEGFVLAPDHDAPERLTIGDRDMIAAIRAVREGLAAPAPPGRRRRSLRRIGLALVLLMAALALAAGVPALTDRIGAAIPREARAALGDAAADAHIGARGCETPAGRRALDALAARLSPDGGPFEPIRVRVLDSPGKAARAAPGGRIVLPSGAIAAAAGPADIAEALALAMGRALARPPTGAALRGAGASGLLGALSGDLGGAGLTAAAAAALSAPLPEPSPREIARAAKVLAVAIPGNAPPLLSDGGWRALRAICAGRR